MWGQLTGETLIKSYWDDYINVDYAIQTLWAGVKTMQYVPLALQESAQGENCLEYTVCHFLVFWLFLNLPDSLFPSLIFKIFYGILKITAHEGGATYFMMQLYFVLV